MSKELKLTDREWKEFCFSDIFEIVDGYYNKKPPVSEDGTLPFLGATQSQNGLTGFTSAELVMRYDKVGGTSMPDRQKRLYRGNCIAITNNGSVGHAYYQATEFTCSHDVTLVYLKGGEMTKHLALFLIPSIQKAGQSFAYAKKWRPIRMRRSKLMLPIDANGTPDWEFMSAYIQQEGERLIASARKKLEKQLLGNIVSLGALNDQEWKDFCFSDIFEIVDGYYNKKPPVSEGGILPFLGATQAQNGMTGFTSVELVMTYDRVGEIAMSDKEKRVYRGGCIAITNDGSVGHAYYQACEFTCSHSITVVYLKGREMTKHLALFLIPSIQKAGQSFAYAKKWRPIRMRRSKLMLPIDANGMPDWEFMSAFMLRMEHENLSKALAFFRPK